MPNNNLSPQTSNFRGSRGKKRLSVTAEANAYQKQWFMSLKQRVKDGEPLVFLGASAPHEIFRAMDIPYVVNQWWAALCSAKQMAPYYLGLLNDRGYRKDLCPYCSLSLASSYDPEPEKGPWGGLPKPSLLVSKFGCDSQSKIFESIAEQYDVPIYHLEHPVSTVKKVNWWEKARFDWEELFDPHILDLMVDELKALIRFLETTFKREFSETKFIKVMDLINQQAELNKKTRDLIASTTPSPVSITDTIPAVMIPQWQRGTEWAVEYAHKLYEEVKGLVDAGYAVCQNEQKRLMWLGRGLWYNMGLYSYFEEKYGAVFIWSIYLAIAADGYARYGNDPLRALASRFAGLGHMLHTPPWNCDWYVHQAKTHKIDGVVHLITESCTNGAGGSYFVKKAFEEAGIPILQLRADPVDARKWEETTLVTMIEEFLEKRLGAKPLK